MPVTDMTDSNLFRREALFRRRRQAEGRPRLITPPGAGLVCVLLLAAAAAAIAFLSASQYTRRTTVAGVVATSAATKRVYARVPGTIDSVRVVPGDAVVEDQLLATLSATGTMGPTDRRRLLAGFDRQIADAGARMHALRAAEQASRDEIEAQMTAAQHDLASSQKLIHIQSLEVAQLKKTRDAAKPLAAAGLVSGLEWQRLSGSVLDARQQLERLSAAAGHQRDRLEALTLEENKLTIETRSRRLDLDQALSKLQQQRRQLAAGRGARIRTRVAGTVANVFVQPGDAVSTHRPIVSITPAGARFVARLLLPSRAVGFVRVGQPVHLLYDAFPYQTFGSFDATLSSISAHALVPGDQVALPPSGAPFFLAIATIERPWVTAYGQRVPLRAGMSLQADVVLDHRSLLAWLLDPLYAAAGRR